MKADPYSGLNMECLRCGKCCNEFSFESSNLKQEDIEKIFPDIFDKHPIKVKKILGCNLKVAFIGKCVNYDSANKACLIYDQRPQLCRDFYCSKAMLCGQDSSAVTK